MDAKCLHKYGHAYGLLVLTVGVLLGIFFVLGEGRLPRDFQKKECITDNSYWASKPMTHSDYAKACLFSTAA